MNRKIISLISIVLLLCLFSSNLVTASYELYNKTKIEEEKGRILEKYMSRYRIITPKVVPTPCPICQPCKEYPNVTPCPNTTPCPQCPVVIPGPTQVSCPNVTPAVCPNITPCPNVTPAVCPSVTPCPQCPECDTGYSYGYPIRKEEWKVMVIDGIDQSFVEDALFFMPNYFSFKLLPDNPEKYKCAGDYPPIPQETWMILVYNSTKYAPTPYSGLFLSTNGCPKIMVGTSGAESKLDVGLLIYHEILHRYYPDEASLTTERLTNVGYRNWLNENDMGSLPLPEKMDTLFYYNYLIYGK